MIRVLLAEDQHMVRGALRALLDLEPDITVVADVDRGDTVSPSVEAYHPDVAVLDIDMPGLDGLQVAALLSARTPPVPTLILTGLGQPAHVARALDAKVAGFLRKNAPSEELADAVRRVARGIRFIDPDLVALAVSADQNALTKRETDVLRAAAGGGSTTDIARELHLAPSTIRNHLSAAFTKLGARNRTDAIRIARDTGWL